MKTEFALTLALITIATAAFAPAFGQRARGPRTEYSDWFYLRETHRDPVRQIGTNKIDLTPVFAWHTNQQRGPNPMPDWFPIIGTASRINTNGLLVVLHPKFPIANPQTKTVWLKNPPHLRQLVDGDPICVLARENGRHQYLDVFRAVTTVPAFDYGTPVASPTTNTTFIGSLK